MPRVEQEQVRGPWPHARQHQLVVVPLGGVVRIVPAQHLVKAVVHRKLHLPDACSGAWGMISPWRRLNGGMISAPAPVAAASHSSVSSGASQQQARTACSKVENESSKQFRPHARENCAASSVAASAT